MSAPAGAFLTARRGLGAALLLLALPAAGATPEQLAALRDKARQFEHGEGVPRDITQAIKHYCEGSRLGDAEAQYSLGWIYANGRGIPRDDSLAAHFFEMAAKQGYAQAERMLRQTGPATGKKPECLFDSAGHDAFPNPSPEQQRVIALVNRLAPEYGIYPRLALAIIRAESNFNSQAVSPKNAQGLMQLIPETSARFNVAKPFDPEQNIRGGLAYLRWLLAYFEGDVALVAAAYNAGEKTVERYAGIPPYPETQGYVKQIKAIFRRDEHPFDPRVTDPAPGLKKPRSAATAS